MEYDGINLGKGLQNYMHIMVQLDVRHPLKRRRRRSCFRLGTALMLVLNMNN